jgi:hypothetical protein
MRLDNTRKKIPFLCHNWSLRFPEKNNISNIISREAITLHCFATVYVSSRYNKPFKWTLIWIEVFFYYLVHDFGSKLQPVFGLEVKEQNSTRSTVEDFYGEISQVEYSSYKLLDFFKGRSWYVPSTTSVNRPRDY